ncbi:PKD domain-containing protein [Streptomyces sp. SID13666]|uniref:PKD domain-containing protein n=1 Tax=unclassified Streptomyces TaxID=2593676 RepID=UPI0013BFFF9C|nr:MULTISPECIES: PKD domain-containing protein [unclassified Streptomyces]NEA58520.1 PKD domain-containing protein [Streptomyces sp. SID13666]NEA72492.1 PKD domain-containing protein [Streptomyces sp. SID13588]
MRYRRQIVISTAALLSSGGLFPLSALADEPVANLYVSRTQCSDTGAGTQALPFCTVQKAADVASPGQTVIIGVGKYFGSVTITRSGTPTAPITFKSSAVTNLVGSPHPIIERPDTSTAATVTVSGAHDIRFAGIAVVYGRGEGIAVLGSTRVALDTNDIGQLTPDAPAAPVDGISVDRASSDVSITRNHTYNGTGHGVSIASGAERVTVASNRLVTDRAGGISATDVSGLTVTGNTIIAGSCSPGLSIAGSSSGTVENNAVRAIAPSGTPLCTAAPLITVAAASTGTVKTAYNALAAAAPRFDYTWGGTGYAKAADLAAAVPGQADQDLDVPTTAILTTLQPEGSPLIDSGDSHALGVTSTDYFGNPRPVDDPNTANTGTGAGTMDRGAFERQSTLTLAPSYSPASAAGAVPFAFAVTAGPTDSWGEPVNTVVDFGDGGDPVPVSGGVASHSYTTPGTYTVSTSATNTDGQTLTRTTQVKALTADAAVVTLTGAPNIYGQPAVISPSTAVFMYSAGADSWQLQSGNLAFGDGQSIGLSPTSSVNHLYAHAGTYTATATTTDLIGRTSTAKTTVTVGNEIVPITPERAYDSRWSYNSSVPAHGTVKLSLAQLGAFSSNAVGAYVTVTVTDTKAGGFLTVHPDGTPRPSVSTLNFGPGQTVPNITMAKAGANGVVDFYNGSSAPISLVVDTFGIELGMNANGGQLGDTYSPVGPVRVLDTREGTGAPKAPVARKGEVVLSVTGSNGVPSDAAAVLLNVATTDAKAAGYLTAYGHGYVRPGTSNSNWAPGQTVSNLILVPVHEGKVVLYNGSGGTVNFVADLVGYYNDLGTASVVVPTSLTRVLDTRTGTGTGGGAAKLGPHQTVRLQIANRNGVPATGMTAAELNMTVTNNVGGGFITAYPAGTARPTASNINFSAGQTVANASVMPTGTDGAIEFYNGSSSPVDLVVDLSGYYYGYTR